MQWKKKQFFGTCSEKHAQKEKAFEKYKEVNYTFVDVVRKCFNSTWYMMTSAIHCYSHMVLYNDPHAEVELLWVLLLLPLASLCVISCFGDGALCSTKRG